MMCYFQGQPVGEYCSCCQRCNNYLSACVPIVSHGYVVGECDFDFCCCCPHYAICGDIWGKEMDSFEADENMIQKLYSYRIFDFLMKYLLSNCKRYTALF